MGFNFSIDAAEFADKVERFSKSKLKRKLELIQIYEETKKNNDEKLFEDIVFNAKYVLGLMRAVQKGSGIKEVSNVEQIKKDFSDNINKTVSQLRNILRSGSDEVKDHFEKSFFELSQEAFINFTGLLSDLEWTKMYLNSEKRK